MDAPKTLEKDPAGEQAVADFAGEPFDIELMDEQEEADPLPVLELDVHHMQVRALNYWAGLLEDGGVPSIGSLSPESDPDLGPYSVVLDFTPSDEGPAITYLGERLAEQWALDRRIPAVGQVPESSFLRRLVGLCVPVLESRAPRDFKAEDGGQDGAATGYRGIALPFCSGGDTVDFVYAVVNWDTPEQEQASPDILLLDQEASDSDGSFMLSADGMAPVGLEGEVHETSLGEWLAEARQFADAAVKGEERSRKALYHAIGHAYDFSLEAVGKSEAFDELAREAGITIQERARMTAVAKLVFGPDYDKTRLTEFATALSHAHRIGVERGAFSAFLERAEGGLKGVVASERSLRREEKGQSVQSADRPRAELARKLRQLVPHSMSELAPHGDEFTLVMAHRLPDGAVVMLGEIPRDVALIERAARKLIGQTR